MFSASIVDAAVRNGSSKLWTQGLWCLSWWQSPNPVVDTGSKARDAVRLKKESYRTMLACGTPDAKLTGTGRPSKQQLPGGPGGKNSGLGGVRAGGELLTSTEDIVGRWKKYFEDLLNPTDLPSSEEAEAGDSEVDSSITRAEVTEVRGTGECVPTYRGITLLSLPGKVSRQGTGEENSAYSRPTLLDSGGTMRFSSWSWNSGPALYPPQGAGGFLWEFAQPVHMCFVDLEKAFDRVPRGILWGVLLCMNDVVLLASSSQDLQHVLERFAAECEAAGMRISTSKSEAMAMVLDRKKGWRALSGPLRVGGEVLPQVEEEFKYLGVLFTSEGKMERERLTGGLVQRPRSYAVGVPDRTVR
ncbi:hypothetical protein L3Q82_023548 [Scortum barcoo]|uniref:Uncharacterized protein n=1 Tax=Scortum barcoo TaxID=214431 RepID=A0ACB8WV71_9TELE|nr:hypothetical protein L3Q82_023548 [Scortum barcoo]